MNPMRTGSMSPVRVNCQDIDSLPLSMAYVPWQTFEDLYKPEDGLKEGTVFMQLNKPFTGRRWER